MATPKNALIALFTVEVPAKWGGGTIRWTNDVNEFGTSIVFAGISYPRMAIEAEGFDMDGEKMPRPKLRCGNADGLVGYQASIMGDFVGAKVTRLRVFACHLDAANFENGNPEADPEAHFRPDVFFVDRKTLENKQMIEWELVCATDIRQAKLPGRTIMQNSCPWTSTDDCQYALTCAKSFTACRTNWGDTAELPFGGFPACGIGRF